MAFVWNKKRCESYNSSSSNYYLNIIFGHIFCLCENFLWFGSLKYVIALTVVGLPSVSSGSARSNTSKTSFPMFLLWVLNAVDIVRTVTNGPLLVRDARIRANNKTWYLCPRLERDMSLMGSFFNLTMFIVLLIGLLQNSPMLVEMWLMYETVLVAASLIICLAHLGCMRTLPSKWEVVRLAFTCHNVIQVACVLRS